MKISPLKLRKIEETLKDFKCLVVRFNEVRNDRVLLREFCSRNRNPIWDLTNIKYFKTGLKSDGLIQSGGKGVDDHYIQRSLCMEIIFGKLSENPDMSVEGFIELLRKYSSTILLTEKEHRDVTLYTRNNEEVNYMVYDKVGIKVGGLKDIIDSTPIFFNWTWG
jgi:hypothetical protein